MIIGASVLQMPAILKAKEMGLYVGVVDYNPNAIGIPHADEYFNASTMDENAVFSACEIFKPDGIMTLATDMPMRGIARASEKLGLNCISYETAIKATDKYEMIKAFNENKVPTPWFYLIDSYDILNSIKAKISFPCIIKPTDNAGSSGVKLVNSINELLSSYEYSLQHSRNGTVIIEEYLVGPEVSVEVMVFENKINIIQITDKKTSGSPYFVEMGHSQPSILSDESQTQISKIAQQACGAVGIDKGPAHVEVIMTSNGPVMIELGARLGGDNITSHLVPLSTGIDLVKSTIKIAIRQKPELNRKHNSGSAIRYFETKIGTLKNISGVDKAKSLPGVVQITFTKKIGERLNEIHTSNDRIGYVIAKGNTAQEAIDVCEKAMNMISILVD